MFVVYMIFRISVGYAKKVLKISQLSSQLLTQEGYCLPPFLLKGHKVFQGFILGDRGVDFLQIGHERLDILIADKAGRGADLMHNAPLHLAVGITGIF